MCVPGYEDILVFFNKCNVRSLSMIEKDIDFIRLTLPDGSERSVAKGTSLAELSIDFQNNYKFPIIAARVGNDLKELNFRLEKDSKIELVDLASDDGMRIYRRSLCFVLIKAVKELFPDRKVSICHSISKGLYCEIKGCKELDAGEVAQIAERMREIVEAKIPFVKHLMSLEEAEEMFIRNGRLDRFHVIEYREKPYVTIYSCDGLQDYFYGYMAPHTGYVEKFALTYYQPGLIMLFPDKSNPDVLPEFKEQKKLFNIFHEFKRWGSILEVENIGALNDIIKAGQIGGLMRVSEALHEKKLAQIADMITNNENRKRIVLISGPSSSGKTTFANRLAIQLRVNGVKPVTISLDDYFIDRSRTPRDEKGEYDFEALEAIDIELFNRQLAELTCGNEVEVPIFNFPKGCRESAGRRLKMCDDQVIIVEGIHGLNEKLTASIPRKDKFKIYASAITSMNIDDHNRIPSTDTRMIRRIVRDFQFRGNSAVNTIKRWPSVRRGEEKNIFPFQEEADIMFNSSLIFELGVLKTYADPLLSGIDASYPEYSEAKRLMEFLSLFLPIDSKEIPQNSIIREFIGGSCFY
jgi:uridine kinase